MDAIFTIPYGEFAAIDKLVTLSKKQQRVSAFVPASRQERIYSQHIRNLG